MNFTCKVALLSSLLLYGSAKSQAQLFNQNDFRDLEMFKTAVAEQLENNGAVYSALTQIHNILAALKSSAFPTAVAKNISQKCLEDSQDYVHTLYRNTSLWALQMKESTGQLPPGLFGAGNVHADGLFDECLAVRAPNFDGQYCSVFFLPRPVAESEIIESTSEAEERSNFLTIFQLFGLLGQITGSGRVKPKVANADYFTYAYPSISFCLPSSCSAADMGQAVAELVGSYIIANYSIITITDEQYCFKENVDPPKFDGPDITVIIVLSLLGFLVVSATIHESWRMYCDVKFDSKEDGTAINFLHCFSALNNGRKILSMKVTASSTTDNLGCVHGIRFLSTCWVVLGHVWSFCVFRTINPLAVQQDALNWWFQIIGNGTVSVDSFFLVSGLLVSYLLLRELDRNKGKFNVGLFYLHRYLRLTVIYALILGYVATLMVYVGTGPNWYSVSQEWKACRISWWKNLLYITNLFPADQYICMGQTWYLSVDMQLFLVSPLLIYPLWRWKKYGLAWLAIVVLASHGAIFAVYAIYDLMPTYMDARIRDNGSSPEFYNYYYVKPWTRAPPYLVGIWVGWYLHVTKNSSIRMSKVVVTSGWVLATTVGLAILYGLTPYLDVSKVPEISPQLKMTYGPLHRTAWGMVIGWIVFACSRGYGGFVNRFLSWKGFLPLGRLTYCVYLIHCDYLNVFYSAIRKNYYYTMLGQFTTSFGVIVISFGFALVASVTLEASFLNLEKLLFSSNKKILPGIKPADEPQIEIGMKPSHDEKTQC